MTSHSLVRVLRRRWASVALVAAAGAAGVYALAGTVTHEHRATSQVFVAFDDIPAAGDRHTRAYARQVVETFAALATTPDVLQPVVDALGLPTTASSLAEVVLVESPADTVLIRVSVTDSSQATAEQVADAVAAQLVVAARTSPAAPVGAVTLSTVADATAP